MDCGQTLVPRADTDFAYFLQIDKKAFDPFGIEFFVFAPLPELMDRKKRDIMERKGDKEDENKRQKQQKESSAAAL